MKKNQPIMMQADFPLLGKPRRGKVRDIYDLGDQLLLVATDRISAFDVVLPNGIPGKGQVLTMISAFWLKVLADIIPNHLLSCNPADYPAVCQPYAEELESRSMLVVKAEPLLVECVVRGYLSGSGWKSYSRDGTICGIKLPPGLVESQEIPPAPIFTPATKAKAGDHDENITFGQMVEIVGEFKAYLMAQTSFDLYRQARESLKRAGIIIADTKFEFGTGPNGRIILIDEVLTPDSSRFWPADGYKPGGPQPSFDKQGVRDYLESISWNKRPPAPELPPEIVEKTSQKYWEAYRRLTEVLV